MSDNLLVTARLASDLGGSEPPKLDALLEYALSPYHPGAVPRHAVDRALPPPPMAAIPIPLARRTLSHWVERDGDPPESGRWRWEDHGGRRRLMVEVAWSVGACSDPVLGVPAADYHEHVNKRLATEHAAMLAPDRRVVVSTTNSWTKSYRIPIRRRTIPAVCWYAVGDRREILKVLRRGVKALGKKVSIGNGRVAEWTVERVEHDYSWFAPLPDDPPRLVLMRTLPIGPWLPMANLVGYRRDFGGVCPPYWHPARACERIVPC